MKQESPLERELAFQITACGLPEPVREWRFAPPRRWRFDFAWPLLDQKLAVEVEGGIWTRGRHTRGKGYQADLAKYNRATLDGWRVLRVTGAQIKSGEAVEWIEQAIVGKAA